MRIEKSITINLVLIALPLFGMLINGYEYGTRDHEHYIPEVVHSADPSYFPNDYLFDEPSGQLTLWIPAMAHLYRWCSLEVVCLIAYVIFQYIMFWSAYHISLNVFRCRASALFGLLLLMLPHEIGGTTMSTYDYYFGLRNPAVATALVCVLLLITRRLGAAAVFAGITFLIHPLIAIPLAFVMAIQVVRLFVQQQTKQAIFIFAVGTVVASPLLVRSFLVERVAPSLGLFGTMHDAHAWIVHARADYIFLSTWSGYALASYWSYFAFLVVILIVRTSTRRKRRCEQPVLDILAVVSLLVFIGFLFSEWIASAFVVQLQLYRCFYLVYYLGLIYAANLLCEWMRERIGASSPATAAAQLGRGFATWQSDAPTLADARDGVLRVLGAAIVIGLLLSHNADAGGVVLLFALLPSLRRGIGPRRWQDFVLLGTGAVSMGFILLTNGLVPNDYFLLIGALATSAAYGVAVLAIPCEHKYQKVLATYVPVCVMAASLGVQLIALYGISQRGPLGVFRFLVQLPGSRQQDPWADVGYWCEANTEKKSVFIVPPDSRSFRIYSNRSIVGDDKDGAKVMFSESFAYAWLERMYDLMDYERITEDWCVALAVKYGATHVVAPRQRELRFPRLYENDVFSVYAIHEQIGHRHSQRERYSDTSRRVSEAGILAHATTH